jgi:non-specific serine/threonine protein kinase/serine/threonine-protein kinase
MAEDTTFGRAPERLKRLLLLGRNDLDDEEPIASWDLLNDKPGSQIGCYRLLRVLGEGGMGMVYLAEQEQPIRRQVALKIVKPGMDSARVIARFEAERQALALLDHPNIAHVYDAGTTESGRPYFVMEYVDGPPITEYCDRRKLTIEQRLSLFQQVCNAVQHAHQKGIIHRDLKPSNIVVAGEGEKAAPKIIDFGVAKAVGKPLTERTLVTEDSHLLGTPEYMSPEQADMASEDVDTRSDVYSLGVLLYVLLTGTLPFDSDTLRTGGIEHIRQVIRETNPKRPSTRLKKLGDEATKAAENRCTQVAALARRLRSELEWIPLKAMRKHRCERYRSAAELADDVENYLKGDPLAAGPPTVRYRLGKFLQRNRILAASVTVVLIVLCVAVIISTHFAIKAGRQARIAQAVNGFLNQYVLRSFNPYREEGGEVTPLSILDAASSKLEGRFEGEPLIEASIHQTLGDMYLNYSQFEVARQHLERALRIQRKHLGEKDPATINSVFSLGYVLKRQGRYEEAEPYLLKALYARGRIFGPAHSRTLYAKHHLGLLYMLQGRYSEWQPMSLELLQTSQLALDIENTTRILAISNTGRLYCFLGHYSRAEPLLVKALDLCRRVKGEQSAWVQEFTGWLGWLYHCQGRYAEAQSLLEQSVEMCRRMRGEEADILLRFTNFLGALYIDQGQYDKAKRLFVDAMATGALRLGEQHPAMLTCTNGLGVVHRSQSHYHEAERLLAEALDGRSSMLGNDHPDTLQTLNDFGVLRREQKRYEEAEGLLCQALEGRQHRLGPDHPDTLESMHELGVLYVAKEEYGEAEQPLLEAFHGREAKLGPDHPDTIESLEQLVNLYESWPKPDEAAKWRAKLPQKKVAEE